jgi:hypothetical protein
MVVLFLFLKEQINTNTNNYVVIRVAATKISSASSIVDRSQPLPHAHLCCLDCKLSDTACHRCGAPAQIEFMTPDKSESELSQNKVG